MAVKEWGYSGAEIARYLGVTGSCVTKIVAKRHLSEEVRLRHQVG
jgi:plasmid maintenance system antidote protein VapI